MSYCTFKQKKEYKKREQKLKYFKKEIQKYEMLYSYLNQQYRKQYRHDMFDQMDPKRDALLRRVSQIRQYLSFLYKKEERIRSFI